VLGGATALGTSAYQERGVSGALNDYGLRIAINEAWFQHDIEMYRDIDLLISANRVVLIGRVPDPLQQVMAEQLAREAGALRLVNRIGVGPDVGLWQQMQDSWLTTRVELALSFDEDVNGLNYAVETIDGVVYVIGEAISEQEARRVQFLASTLPGVRKVETYIHVASVIGRESSAG
jgi:osmotically-inducible protein OsmY